MLCGVTSLPFSVLRDSLEGLRKLQVHDVHRHELDARKTDDADEHGEDQEPEKRDAALPRTRSGD